jgi:hypothetical protein
MRVVVTYDPSFSKLGTWCLALEGDGIRARFRLGEAAELVVDAPLRWMKLRVKGVDSHYVHPIDAARTTWLVESSAFAGQVGVPIELQLNGATEFAARSLGQL